jgi:hypothetical protein
MASTHKSLRSGTANKRPTTSIAEGQIALNTNATSPGLYFKDSTGAAIIKIGPVHVGTTAPNVAPAGSSGNSTGEAWLDTSLTPNGWKVWTGAAWVNATPAGSSTVQGLLELATDAETQAGSDTARAVTPAGLQSKVSDSTSTTSSTTIASSTAVKAAYDLANAALPKSGGTVTGNLEIGNTGSLTFEGATADAFETTIAVVDPTADRTITLPNVTGTVVTTGDTGSVTNAMINASAAIAGTKISPDFGSQNIVTTGGLTVDTNTLYVDATTDRVGIGTTSPATNNTRENQKLSVVSTGLNQYGGASLTSYSGAGIADPASILELQRSRGITDGSMISVAADDSLGRVGWRGSDGTAFIDAALIRADVDGTPGTNAMPGRLVFSTTASGAANPTERMRIGSTGVVSTTQPNTNQSGLSVGLTSASYANDGVTIWTATAAGTGFYFLRCWSDSFASLRFQVIGNGNVQNANNSYGATSDIKLKENIVDAGSQWADLKALQVRKYNFKDGQTHTQIGLVAQEVELVSPGLVTETPDRDQEGNDLGTTTKAVQYSVLYMKAVKALQEAMERIETLEARLTAAGIE